MRYLFIGAHVDEEVCFGGTIIKLVEQGHSVDLLAYSNGTAYESEWIESNKIMGSRPLSLCLAGIQMQHRAQTVADDLYRLRNAYDVVFSHAIVDRHPLHRMVAEESRRVFNGNLITYMGYWNGFLEKNYYVEITKEHLDKKIAALACYKTQSHRPYMKPGYTRANAKYMGMGCGKKYAEGFKIERYIQ